MRRRGHRRAWATATGVMLLGVAIAACGGDDGDSDDTPSTTAPAADAPGGTPGDTTGDTGGDAPGDTTGQAPPDSTGEGPAPSSAPEGEPTPGGEIVVGTIFDAFGLEPTTLVGQSTDGPLGWALYDNLVTYDEQGQVVGWLAESMTTEDQQHWTIELREGVEFQDGTPLDAEAVKFNLERHQNPELRSRQLANAQKIVEMNPVDPLTLELTLDEPWAAFDEIMTGNLGLMASPTAAEAGTLNEQPVGTGPFTLAERIPGDRVVLERNEDYWREGEPYLDKITFRVMLDDSVRVSSVASGEVDVVQSIFADEMTAAIDDGLEATWSPGRGATIHFNVMDGPTADVRIRQALAQGIDYEALNDVIYAGDAMTGYQPMLPENPFYADDIEFPTYDPEEATRLVDEYEAEHGDVAIAFRCYTGPTRVQLAQLLSQMWSAVGIDVDVQLSDQGTLVTDMLGGNFEVGCLGINAGTVDPDLLFYNAYYTGQSGNYSGYSDPEMDAALDAGRTGLDDATRMEAYHTVQEIYARDVPVVIWASSPNGWVTSPEVNGLVTLTGSEFHPSTVWLASS